MYNTLAYTNLLYLRVFVNPCCNFAGSLQNNSSSFQDPALEQTDKFSNFSGTYMLAGRGHSLRLFSRAERWFLWGKLAQIFLQTGLHTIFVPNSVRIAACNNDIYVCNGCPSALSNFEENTRQVNTCKNSAIYCQET